MIEVLGQLWDCVLGVRLDGDSLTDGPDELIPLLNDLIESNNCDRCVIEMHNLDSAAYYPFWEELTCKEARTEGIRRCAVISEAWAEQWARNLITPLFKSAQVKWFEDSRLSSAWKWATQSELVEDPIEEIEMIGHA